MDKETRRIAALKCKRRQYFDNPSAMSRYRTRYKKYKLSPQSTIRKKLFSSRSQISLKATMVGLADGMWAMIHMQKTEMLTKPMSDKESPFE